MSTAYVPAAASMTGECAGRKQSQHEQGSKTDYCRARHDVLPIPGSPLFQPTISVRGYSMRNEIVSSALPNQDRRFHGGSLA
jgi:hypothetical protein